MNNLFDKLWKENNLNLDINLNCDLALEDEESAIILSTNINNYERYFALENFKNIFKKTNKRLDLYNIQYIQICIINLIKKSFINKNNILNSLKILNKINDNSLMIDFIQNIKIQNKNNKFNNLNKLNDINLKLQELSDNEKFIKELKQADLKFNDLKFNIAITGIMNAGKSSMLNALLKNDLLRVSNIPETANLTIINYGDDEFAKVYFFNEKECQNIKNNNENLKNFDLSFLKNDNLIKKIHINDLKNYTSAKNEISAFIQKVKINARLDFLKNNICIVDTPGLDDMIKQREIITNEYLNNSDFIIHLMNVSCALTQKDVDFLIKILINSRVSKILIVLTKSDLLDKDDLDEVINYSKKNLSLKFKEYCLDENYINNIDFLCISSKKALDFYKNLANEQDFKESNIEILREYLLNEFLSNKKLNIAYETYKKELNIKVDFLIKEYEIKNKFIKNNNEDLNNENLNILSKIKEQTKLLQSAKNDIKIAIDELNFDNNLLNSCLIALKNNLKDKILNEIKYFKNKNIKFDKTRLMVVIDTSLKDGFGDVLRDLKYENIKKIENIKENLCLKYSFLQNNFDLNFEDFKEKMNEIIDSILNSNSYENLKFELKNNIDIKDINILELNLSDILNKVFLDFNLKNIVLNLNLNASFLSFLKDNLLNYEQEENKKINLLQDSLKNYDLINLNKIYEQNLEKINLLNQIKMDLNNAN